MVLVPCQRRKHNQTKYRTRVMRELTVLDAVGIRIISHRVFAAAAAGDGVVEAVTTL